MAQPIEHDAASGAATVAGSAAKGAVFGAFTPLIAGALAVGGIYALFAFTPLLIAIPIIAVTAFTAPIWGPVALVGMGLGALFGAHKVHSEQRAFDEKSLGLQTSMPQPQPAIDPQAIYQQGVQAGAQAGANQVLDRLQQIQAQAQQEAAQVAQPQAPQPAQPALEAISVPPQEQAQPIVHHFVHDTPHEHFEAVHASGEITDSDNNKIKGHFTAMVADKKGSLDLQKIIEQRAAANDPQFATARQA